MSSEPLKLSIVTVVYNRVNTLENAIQSVIKQSYPNIEYIIIDGGSTDGTLDIIKKYENHISFWISEPDKGLSDAMNKGVSYATGDAVLLLHSDDALINESSAWKLMNGLQNSGKYWATGFYRFKDKEGNIVFEDRITSYSFFHILVLRNMIKHQATIVRTEVFKVIKFRPKYKYAMDYDFFLRVWDKYGDPEYVPDYITYFGLTGLSSNVMASLNSEMEVRIDYRKEHQQWYWIPFDYIIYWIRAGKIKLDILRGRK